MSKSIPTDEIKGIICHRIKIFSKTGLEYKNDTYISDMCRNYVCEDIELLRKLNLIDFDMYYDLMYNRCIKKDFVYLINSKI